MQGDLGREEDWSGQLFPKTDRSKQVGVQFHGSPTFVDGFRTRFGRSGAGLNSEWRVILYWLQRFQCLCTQGLFMVPIGGPKYLEKLQCWSFVVSNKGNRSELTATIGQSVSIYGDLLDY